MLTKAQQIELLVLCEQITGKFTSAVIWRLVFCTFKFSRRMYRTQGLAIFSHRSEVSINPTG
jgi:hypothetical protein